MGGDEIEAKALDLMTPIIGSDRASALIGSVLRLDDITRVTELRQWLTA
jgi:hypothetical protein